jgi:hypothetical protein
VSDPARASLGAIVTEELSAPAPLAVAAIGEAARDRHGDGVVAVLFYGSCRRDGYREGLLVDLYLIVSDYTAVHRSWAMRWLNHLVPPNVYYIETSCDGDRVRAKYALVSLPQLEQLTGPTTLNPYFWARFAQPTGLLWSQDPAVARHVADALVEAILTMDRAVRPLLPPTPDAASLWTRALRESYRTELRAEKPERAAEIVRGDLERYRRVSAALGPREPDGSAARAARRWFLRRLQGRGLSLLRLAKASWTFAGGADYLAWKISRHAGVPVVFSAWERRHPFLAAPFVLWRLARRRVVR